MVIILGLISKGFENYLEGKGIWSLVMLLDVFGFFIVYIENVN